MRPPSAFGHRDDRAARAARALAAAAEAGYGPGTPLPERDAKMAELVGAGCYLQEIAVLFGVSRATVARRLKDTR